MSNKDIDSRCHFRKSHEWVRPSTGASEYEAGITGHAEHALGDVVFVELPAIGKKIALGETFGVIESVKAASDLYMPMSGVITAVNQQLVDDPSLINSDCYGAGWIIRFSPSDLKEWDTLLDANAYKSLVDSE